MIHKGICNHSCAPVVNHSYAPACNHSYTMDGLAERIAKIRKEAGDTLSQAAKHVGISRQAYTKWEVGDTADMRFANIMKFCDHYKIKIEALLRGTIYDSIIETTKLSAMSIPADQYCAKDLIVVDGALQAYKRDAERFLEFMGAADPSVRAVMRTIIAHPSSERHAPIPESRTRVALSPSTTNTKSGTQGK